MAATILLALVIGTLSVLLALFLLGAFTVAARPRKENLQRPLEPLAFMFRQQVLVDATMPARALLEILQGESDWQRLMAWLSARLDGMEDLPARLAKNGSVTLMSDAPTRTRMRALFEAVGDDALRVTLSDPSSDESGVMVDALTFAAMEDEIELLRSAMDCSPMLAWREDAGAITWANSAYLKLAETRAEEETLWPLPRLIELPDNKQQHILPRRSQIEEGDHVHWFECHSQTVGDSDIAVALPADAAVRAERSLREFVQTLTKTFADLPIGMAIFDRDRNLQLFNPALIDLTGLSAGFLTARPTLYAVLDRLREARMVPEPKDYRSWRNHMSTLETAAASGHHVETWSLPGGQTYRVTGRPHPDGAVAFLFEDITSEISLTRKFRADLNLGKEVLDALDDAIAVFGGNGQLSSSNSAYADLWGEGMRPSIADHTARWQLHGGAGPGFQALYEAIGQRTASARLQGVMAGPDGQLLNWSLRQLLGGRMMVRFSMIPELQAISSDEGEEPRDVGLAGDKLALGL